MLVEAISKHWNVDKNVNRLSLLRIELGSQAHQYSALTTKPNPCLKKRDNP
jgi:hypothetical protein